MSKGTSRRRINLQTSHLTCCAMLGSAFWITVVLGWVGRLPPSILSGSLSGWHHRIQNALQHNHHCSRLQLFVIHHMHYHHCQFAQGTTFSPSWTLGPGTANDKTLQLSVAGTTINVHLTMPITSPIYVYSSDLLKGPAT